MGLWFEGDAKTFRGLEHRSGGGGLTKDHSAMGRTGYKQARMAGER